MFEDLAALNERPAPFSVYTADILWTDPHISARMLDFHLDAEGDVASRRASRALWPYRILLGSPTPAESAARIEHDTVEGRVHTTELAP